ncbi:MAG: nucleoside monophosphate kinase [Anaerolineae bacterium]|jgi:adenylate kinase|nr:nucleoside monophosphate kinase [Anaerolineae bacterium]
MGLYIILMGVQGAGKGEQAKFIQQAYGIPQVSTGDLFRALKTREDDFARRVQATMAAGQLIDDATTNQIVVERLAQPDAAGGVIFDGYPRNEVQAQFLADYLRQQGQTINAVILLELDVFVAFKRAFGRVTAADGSSYNYYYKTDGVQFRFEDHPDKLYPPRLVATLPDGTTLLRRPDDASAAAIIKRIDTYLSETMPLLPFFEKHGMLYRVDASRSLAEVSADIGTLLERVRH